MRHKPNQNPVLDEARQDEALSSLLQETFQVENASSELRDRVAQMAAQAQFQTSLAPTRKRRFFGMPRTPQARLTFGVCVVMVCLFSLSMVAPRVQGNLMLSRVEAALAKVSQVHRVVWLVKPDGKRVKTSESWFQGDQLRMNTDTWQMLYNRGRQWMYDVATDTATITTEKNALQKPTGFTLDELLKTLNRTGNQFSTKVLGNTTYQGREVSRVQISSKQSNSYELILFVDTETNLPLRGETMLRNGHGQSERMEWQASYNEPISATVFEPKFSATQKIVDVDQSRAEWLGRLNQSLMSQTVGERTIAIRDFQVNERGDVFTLYTAGKRPGDDFLYLNDKLMDVGGSGRDWKVSLSDNLGTLYHPMKQNRMESFMSGIRRVVGNTRVESDWWVPDTAPQAGQRWQPRTFTLHFESSLKNVHGSGTVKAPSSALIQTTFKVQISAPQSKMVPAYVPFLFTPSIDAKWITQAEDKARNVLTAGTQISPQLVRELISKAGTPTEFSPDGALMVTQTANLPGIQLWDSTTGRKVRTLPHSGTIAFSPDRKTLAVATATRDAKTTEYFFQFRLYDVTTGQVRATWKKTHSRDGFLKQLAFGADGKTLYALTHPETQSDSNTPYDSFAGKAQVIAQEWDAMTGQLLSKKVLPHSDWINGEDQAVADASTWIAATGENLHVNRRVARNLVQIWDGRTGKRLREAQIPAHAFITNLKISANARVLVAQTMHLTPKGQVTSGNSPVCIVDVATGQLKHSFLLNADSIHPLALSADGKLLATPGQNAIGEQTNIQVRDTQTGRVLCSLVGHGTTPQYLVFSPDGKTLLSSDEGGRVLQWKLNG